MPSPYADARGASDANSINYYRQSFITIKESFMRAVIQGAAVAAIAILALTASIPIVGAATDGIGSSDGEQSGTRVIITELKRGGGTLTLKFIVFNDSAVGLGTGGKFNADGYHGYRNVSGVHLVDPAGKKKYFAVKDSEGSCECSDNIDDIAPKSQIALWVRFPAPPDNVVKVAVQIPHFIPVDDVPIK
jgi:hypothetical protein